MFYRIYWILGGHRLYIAIGVVVGHLCLWPLSSVMYWRPTFTNYFAALSSHLLNCHYAFGSRVYLHVWDYTSFFFAICHTHHCAWCYWITERLLYFLLVMVVCMPFKFEPPLTSTSGGFSFFEKSNAHLFLKYLLEGRNWRVHSKAANKSSLENWLNSQKV